MIILCRREGIQEICEHTFRGKSLLGFRGRDHQDGKKQNEECRREMLRMNVQQCS